MEFFRVRTAVGTNEIVRKAVRDFLVAAVRTGPNHFVNSSVTQVEERRGRQVIVNIRKHRKVIVRRFVNAIVFLVYRKITACQSVFFEEIVVLNALSLVIVQTVKRIGILEMNFIGNIKIPNGAGHGNLKRFNIGLNRHFSRVSACGKPLSCFDRQPVSLIVALCNGQTVRIMSKVVFLLDKRVGIVAVGIAFICIIMHIDIHIMLTVNGNIRRGKNCAAVIVCKIAYSNVFDLEILRRAVQHELHSLTLVSRKAYGKLSFRRYRKLLLPAYLRQVVKDRDAEILRNPVDSAGREKRRAKSREQDARRNFFH